MFFLINNINNLHLKMYAKVEIPDLKLTQVNTIEYDTKSQQVKTTIINCTDAKLKGLRILTANRREFGISDKYVT